MSVMKRRDLIDSTTGGTGAALTVRLFVGGVEQPMTANLFHLTNGGRKADDIYVTVRAATKAIGTGASVADDGYDVPTALAAARSLSPVRRRPLPGAVPALSQSQSMAVLPAAGGTGKRGRDAAVTASASSSGIERRRLRKRGDGASESERSGTLSKSKSTARIVPTGAGGSGSSGGTTSISVEQRWDVECKQTVSVKCLHGGGSSSLKPSEELAVRVDLAKALKTKFKPERYTVSIKKSLLSGGTSEFVVLITHDGIIHVSKSTRRKETTLWTHFKRVSSLESKHLVIEAYQGSGAGVADDGARDSVRTAPAAKLSVDSIVDTPTMTGLTSTCAQVSGSTSSFDGIGAFLGSATLGAVMDQTVAIGDFLKAGRTTKYEYFTPEFATAIESSLLSRQQLIHECVESAKRNAIADKFQQSLMKKHKLLVDEHNFMYEVGDLVRLTQGRVGIVVYKGSVHFAMGEHYGVALVEGLGEHDGKREGIRYFKTRAAVGGTLVPLSQIVRKINGSATKKHGDADGTAADASKAVRGEFDADDPSGVGGGARLSGADAGVHKRVRATLLPTVQPRGSGLGFADNTEDDIFTSVRASLVDEATKEGSVRKQLWDAWPKIVQVKLGLKCTGMSVIREVMDFIKAECLLRRDGAIYRNRLFEARKQRQKLLKAAKMEGTLRMRGGMSVYTRDSVAVVHSATISGERASMLGGGAFSDSGADGTTVGGGVGGAAPEERLVDNLALVDAILNDLLESAIEQTVLSKEKIEELNVFCEQMCVADIVKLKNKMIFLRRCPQSYFGIRKEIESTEYWQTPTYELSLFRGCLLPSEKVNALLNCCKAVYHSFDREQREVQMKTGKPCDERITGDDLLPIVIYVIVQSSALCIDAAPPVTEADLLLLEGLSDPVAQKSETGYYIAVFHAALKWLSDFKV